MKTVADTRVGLNVTYGQLDKVLRSLGFTYHLAEDDPPTRLHDHRKSDSRIMLPAFPDND